MFLFPMMFRIPDDYNIPPTLYSIMNSIVNFENDNPVKIKDLAENSRSKIFDFNYPLSSEVNKEEFECQILNHFIMRRIGYETMTAFKIALNSKLNEIMPLYNKLFDALSSWNIFEGENTERTLNDNRIRNEENNITNSMINSTSSNNVSDRRNSELPQDEIIDVRNGSYMTDYNYDTDNSSTSSDTSSSSNSNTNNNETYNLNEKINKTAPNEMDNYIKFIEKKQNIMTMIYKDLDVLFYGIV